MSWPIIKMEELAAKVPYSLVGGPFGSKLTSIDYINDGVPVIRGSNLGKGKFLSLNEFVYVSDAKMRQDFSSNLAYPGDLVFTQRGTLGQVAIIPEESPFEKYVISQSQMKMTVDEDKACKEYLYYYFTSTEAVQRIINFTSSSGVPHINLTILRNFEVPIPPVRTQRAISSILSAYDDLIENNRRRMQLLEQAARLLYKEWFVRLRFPGHEHVKIKDGVPEGWERKPLGKIAPLNYGKALKQDNRIPGAFPVYGSSGVVGTHQKALVEGPGIIVGRKGNVGSVFWCEEAFHPIDTVYFIGPEKSTLHLYYALLHTAFMSTDVAVPGLNRDFAHSHNLLIPESKVAQLFEEIVSSVHQQIYGLQKHNQALAKARDLLLPRLMNGEIAV